MTTRSTFILTSLGLAGALLLPFAAGAESDACPQIQARTAIKMTPTVLLDVNGDGISDFVASSRAADPDTRLFWTFSGSGATAIESLPAGRPVPADYDGDGKVDLATVAANGANLVWNIKRSSDGVVTSRTFGRAGNSILYGCRMTGPGKASLVVIQDRKVIATDLTTDTVTNIGTLPSNSEEVLGCGDLTGTGVDDLVFTVTRRNTDLRYVASLVCKKDALVYRSIKDFRSAGIIQVDQDDFPLLVTLRSLDRKRDIVTLQSVSELFPYPKFFYEKNTNYTNGRYKSVDGTLTSYGLAYAAQNGSGQILQRLLDAPIPRPEIVTTMPAGYELVAPQGVLK